MRYALLLFAWAIFAVSCPAETFETDVCVYGGTAGGVAAAVQAARMGKTVVLLEFGRHLGGMTSGGLGATDIGNKAAIGGIARELYHRVALHYAKDDAWPFENREEFFARRGGRTTLAELKSADSTMWVFEPHVAEDILKEMLREAKVPVHFQQRLASAKTSRRRISEIKMDNGNVFRAKMFIDSTYEGDLMAKAGVSFTVGREANSTYNETINGVRAQTPKHQFKVAVDPYVKPGDRTSGLLKFIQSGDGGQPGAGDKTVQAYNFRLCYTKNPANRLPHTKPENYNPADFELLARYLEALVASGHKPVLDEFWNPIWMPNGKTDINNNGGFSTDFIGANYDYPNGDFVTRQKIWEAHEDYIRSFVYFLATSPRIPENMRREMQEWGPAKDEFRDTDSWPHQLYIREARRMVSDYVMTEHNCRGKVKANDPVGLGAYGMDSHNCQRLVKNGRAENEGDVQVHGFSPYGISYRSIVPKTQECENLLVPVCLSATHISYGSIRMEPVFMVLGQSAATAAVLAIDDKDSVQKVNYSKLRERLLADKQVLDWAAPPQQPGGRGYAEPLTGILVDDQDATKVGDWSDSTGSGWRPLGNGYIHDGNSDKGLLSITFTPTIPEAGEYEIVVLFPPHLNRAMNVPVEVSIEGRKTTAILDQRKPDTKGMVSLGKFQLPKGKSTAVTISNRDTRGYVVADGVQFVPVK
jgi:ribulose 1,5-bisphosphate synthetase/thiazole synthase